MSVKPTGIAVFDLTKVANNQAMKIIQFPKDEVIGVILI